MTKKLSGRSISKKYIELHGQFGEFDIDSKKIKITYFSTYASSRNKLHNSFDLLRELKPMRERVLAKEISNLDSLLQRDLNDFRVANELIPYLTNSQPPIAFFPAVLAVLIPKGFIAQNEESKYPVGSRTDGDTNSIINYEDCWKLEIFKFGDQESSLGALSIDPENVDIIVLDGQHRSNAFRVVSGTFENDRNSIYSTFYKDIQPIKDFKADLPVTIIWFDNDSQNFDPKLISRRLFVDVNNSAKKVSKSRTILLDEYEIPSLLTRFFYSKLADSRKFNSGEFSLFHSDFDLDSDISVSSNNAFAITNPQIIYDIFSWICLGRTDRYHSLDSYSVGRESFRNSEIAFGRIFDNESFNEKHIQSDESLFDQRRVVLKSSDMIGEFSKSYEEKLGSSFFRIYSDFNFFRNHYKAAELIDSTQDQMDHVENAVWEDIFRGGEGLYYTFKDRNLRMKDDIAWKKYQAAIDSIEKKFKERRKDLFEGHEISKVNKAYDSANTKAFQIAVFMALDLFKEDLDLDSVYEDYISRLNSKSPDNWVIILTDIRQKVVKETSPKMWPAYQKVILRAIQSEETTYYDSENFHDSPDGKVFYSELKNSLNSWIDLNDEVDFEELTLGKIGKKVYGKWIESAQNSTEELFLSADILPIPDVDYFVEGKDYLGDQIEKLKG